MLKISPRPHNRALEIFLYLLAIHSGAVGLLLIVLPIEAFGFFGISVCNRFFPTQAGVFHLMMAVIYMVAARRLGVDTIFAELTIGIKLTATAFLLTYYIFKENVPIILMSGIVDFVMGLGVYFLGRDMLRGRSG